MELIKELDKRLPQYEFEFKTMDFGNLLLSLDAGKIDLVSHQMEKTRSAKPSICSTKIRIAFF